MAEGAWETVHVLFSRADNKTGAITCQTGDLETGEVLEPNATVFQAWGWLAMCAPAARGVSPPEAIALKGPGVDVIVGGRSVRSAAIAGLIKAGESCAYADGSQACTLYKLDGSIVGYTTHDNTANGQAVIARQSPTGFEWQSPWSRMRLNDTGFHLFSIRSDGTPGARIDLGSVAGLPAPFDGMGTYLTLGAALVRISGSTIILGADAGAHEPVAKAQTLMAVLASVASALTSTASALQAVLVPAALTSASPGSPVVVTPPLIAALQAAASALGTASSALTVAITPAPTVAPIASSSTTVT